ncbi:MAG: alpha/beta hydrolase, partial [Nonomuraea sp.]|nr:alpha/beta hydrolase [Nonomuraea sp.]
MNAALVNGESAEAGGSPTLPLDGGNIYVRQDGPADGPALVLIHGLAASARSWDALVPLLATSYRVIRIDLLGHGRSAKPAGDGYGMPEQGRRVAQAMDRLGVKHAVIVGHSTGGAVATALAEQRPDLVTALAIIDTAPRLSAAVDTGFLGGLLDDPVIGQLLWRFRTDGLIRNAASTAF